MTSNSGSGNDTNKLLKARVQLAVGSIARAALTQRDQDSRIGSTGQQVVLSAAASFALTQLVHDYSVTFAEELTHFAAHAKRQTISGDDVKLAARKSHTLLASLDAKAEELKQARKKNAKPKSTTTSTNARKARTDRSTSPAPLPARGKSKTKRKVGGTAGTGASRRKKQQAMEESSSDDDDDEDIGF